MNQTNVVSQSTGGDASELHLQENDLDPGHDIAWRSTALKRITRYIDKEKERQDKVVIHMFCSERPKVSNL